MKKQSRDEIIRLHNLAMEHSASAAIQQNPQKKHILIGKALAYEKEAFLKSIEAKVSTHDLSILAGSLGHLALDAEEPEEAIEALRKRQEARPSALTNREQEVQERLKIHENALRNNEFPF